MGRVGGNPGNKGGGRKPFSEEIKFALKREREKVTDEILSGKAKDITYAVMQGIEEKGEVSLETMKGVVIPVTLKGMVTRQDLTTGGMPLILPSELLNKNNIATNEPNAVTDKDSSIA